MASTILKFPSGNQIEQELTTAYKDKNTNTSILVFKTPRKENENYIVGISYKKAGEDCYTKVVGAEDWNAVKKVLVDDIHDRKEDFEYIIPDAETKVTEDYAKELALREENRKKIESNYEEFLKLQQVEKTADIVPFPSQEPEKLDILEEPSVMPQAEIQPKVPEVSVEPEVATVSETIMPESTITPEPIVAAPVIEEPVINNGMQEIQNVIPTPEVAPTNLEETNNIVEFPSAPSFNGIIEEQPKEEMVNTPVIQDVQIKEPVGEISEDHKSVVAESYLSTANELLSQMRVLTDKYLQTMEDMIGKMDSNLKETEALKGMYVGAVDKAEQILASQAQNVEVESTMSRAA